MQSDVLPVVRPPIGCGPGESCPLFCRERISAERIVAGRFRGGAAEGSRPALRSYRFPGGWENRLIWGDSARVMESLLLREGRKGEVQTIYFDPPYGVNFSSCFEPFARKDGEAERGPERVKAYRDAWQYGLSSYLDHLRERLLLCRDLLHPTGSLFLQIGEENLHHVRFVLDGVFGEKNFVSLISFRKTSAFPGNLLPGVSDYLLWYAKRKELVKYRPLYRAKRPGAEGALHYRWVELPDGSHRKLSPAEEAHPGLLPPGAKVFALGDLRSAGASERGSFAFSFAGRTFRPYPNSHWKTTREGMERLAEMGRLVVSGRTLMYKRYLSDFPMAGLTNHWSDVRPSFQRNRGYVVETVARVVERCLLMTSDPGDLLLDPTGGGGTAALVAERWGRRWICIDAAPVSIALIRMRLLTAAHPDYALRLPERGPAGGFVYARRRNRKGEEVGGIVPHLTLGALAKGRPAAEELLVDRPERASGIRLSGPFSVEGILPASAPCREPTGADRLFAEQMREALRRSPVFEAAGRKRIVLEKIRAPDRPSVLGAEAELAGERVGIAFGTEKDPVGEALVRDAAREAARKGYRILFLVGFAIDAGGLERLRKESRGRRRLSYVQASLDLLMGGRLKATRASQLFSLSGVPEIRLRRAPRAGDPERWRVDLLGMKRIDPLTGACEICRGEQLPAWFLDADYDGVCFRPGEAVFPRTDAWAEVRRLLRKTAEAERQEGPEARRSAFFEPGTHRRIAVKTIDERGTELLTVRRLPERGPRRPGAATDSAMPRKTVGSDAPRA